MFSAFRRVALASLFIVVAAEAGAQCGPWTVVPGPPAQGSWATVWAGDRFVAVGDGFFLSPDGRSWRNVPQEGFPPGGDSGLSWSAVAFSGTELVAVADGGANGPRPSAASGAIAVSARGEHWQVVVPVTNALHAVAWGGGRWVAAGTSLFLWSEDGRNWHQGTVASGSSSMDVLSVAFTGSRWVAVGGDELSGGSFMASSEDGATWNVTPADARLSAVASNGVRTVAVGSVALSSDDGLTWTSHELPAGVSLGSLIWNGARFVGSGTISGWERQTLVVLESSDGVQWDLLTQEDIPPAPFISSLGGAPGVLLGLGWPASVLIGPDGRSWEPAGGTLYGRNIRALQRAGGMFMALAEEFGPGISLAVRHRTDLETSTDGIHWSSQPIGDAGYYDLAWRDGRYAAGGFDGLMISDDGVQWSRAFKGLPSHYQVSAVAAGNPGFVALLDSGIYFSGDGASWQQVTAPAGIETPDRALTWAGDRFIAASADGVATSPDGITWTAVQGVWGLDNFRAFAGNGSRFVGIGGGGLLAWSGDGLHWTTVDHIPPGGLFGVTWDGQEFLVAGAGFLLRSTGGENWSSESTPDTPWYGGIASLDGRTVIAGRSGSLLVRACPDETLESGEGFRLALPAMANTPGRKGTFWRSDLVLHNPGAGAVRVGVWPLYDTEGRGGVPVASVVIDPGKAVTLQDLLPGLLGSARSSGGAILAADGPVLAASRTFTGRGDGTWGQNVPLLSPEDWIEPGQRVVIPGIGQDGSVRTNLGLLNPSGSPLTVHARFHGADGTLLGEHSWTVPAWGWRQIDLVLEQAQAAPVSLAWAELDGDDGFVAYASVIDNATGDSVTVLPKAPAAGELVVPAAAHAPGFGGVLWRTDLDLVAAGDGPARYRLELLPAAGPVLGSGERTLEAGHEERLADVIGTVFGALGGGAIRIVVLDGELAASSRTYAVGPGGSFGQAIPALPANGGPGGGTLRLAGLSGSLSDDGGFRTDIGAVNLSGEAVSLGIDLYAGDGTLVGRRQLDLDAASWGQLDRVFRGLAATPVVGGYAVISTTGAGGQVLAYASVIDNRTGDPVFLPAVATGGE